jgi:twitching motility protein PilT
MVEDKDRTKEIPDAISQGHTTYGMQTFDQSLMGLLKAGFVTYEEALRQATNPDDFALRVSGISGTSDSKWDGFEAKAEGAGSAPATARPPPSVPRVPPGSTPQQGVALGRVQPAKVPAPRPQTPSSPGTPAAGGDDDFQIERF